MNMRKYSYCKTDYTEKYIRQKYNELIIYNSFIKRLSGKNFRNVLDCGCGYGRVTQYIKDFFSYKRFVLLDISKKAIIKYKERLKVSNMFFINADAEELPFQREVFDLVLLVEVISYTDNPRKVIKELYRVLTQKGLLMASVENRYGGLICDPYLRKNDLEKVLLKGEREEVKYFTEGEFFEILIEVGFEMTKDEILKIEDICKKDKEFANFARAICVLAEKR